MGRKRRKRQAHGAGDGEAQAKPAAATDYADADGNVLTLRDHLSERSLEKIARAMPGAAATRDDAWQRRSEMLFERLAVRWTIAELPLEQQDELLARYRIADGETRRWVREVIDRHLAERHPGLEP